MKENYIPTEESHGLSNEDHALLSRVGNWLLEVAGTAMLVPVGIAHGQRPSELHKKVKTIVNETNSKDF